MTCLRNNDVSWILKAWFYFDGLQFFTIIFPPLLSLIFESRHNNNQTPICIHIRRCIFEAGWKKFHAFLLIFQCHFSTNARLTERWTFFDSTLTLSLFFHLFISLSFSHNHTHTLSLTHTHTHLHTCTYASTHIHSFTHTCAHTHTLAYYLSHSFTFMS